MTTSAGRDTDAQPGVWEGVHGTSEQPESLTEEAVGRRDEAEDQRERMGREREVSREKSTTKEEVVGAERSMPVKHAGAPPIACRCPPILFATSFATHAHIRVKMDR